MGWDRRGFIGGGWGGLKNSSSRAARKRGELRRGGTLGTVLNFPIKLLKISQG